MILSQLQIHMEGMEVDIPLRVLIIRMAQDRPMRRRALTIHMVKACPFMAMIDRAYQH